MISGSCWQPLHLDRVTAVDICMCCLTHAKCRKTFKVMPARRDGNWHGELGMWSTYDINGEPVQVGAGSACCSRASMAAGIVRT
jgi:hypothetical protein